MTIQQMEGFLTLAETLNFTQAAALLFTTQPTLSRMIGQVEQEVGVQLVSRNTRKVSLTPAGQNFARHCRKVLDSYQNSLIAARETARGSSGIIRLGLQQDAFEPFSVDLIRSFRRQHKHISLELEFYSISGLIAAFDEGRLDCCIGGSQPYTPSAQMLLLSGRKECAVLPPDHPLAQRSSLRLEELSPENFVVMSREASASGYSGVIQKATNAGFVPHIVAQADQIPSLLMMVACGLGVSILYEDLQPTAYGRVVFVPLEGDVPPFRRWLIWDGLSPNPCLQQLVRSAQELFGGQIEEHPRLTSLQSPL